jgi:hypothetical protein
VRGAALLAIALAAAGAACAREDAGPGRGAGTASGPYAGAAACAGCHATAAGEWTASAHGRHGTVVVAPEGGCDGAVGTRWMQAFFRRDDRGFLRILPRCLDLRTREWVPVAAVLEEIRGSWSGAPLGAPEAIGARPFDTDCAGCHASQPAPRLDLLGGRMETRAVDVSLNCETCHGAGRAHAEGWERLEADARMPRLSGLSPRASVALCARCHGGPPTAGDFGPADAEDYVAVIADRPGFFPSGAAAGQVYQAPAFLRSPCHLRGGLTCTGCHEHHGTGLVAGAGPDALCASCHAEKATRAHTFHDPRGDGARCVECHMPRLLRGLLAHQRDHRIAVPVPGGESPDACTACHRDRDAAWAVRAWRERWGEPPAATLEAERGISLARRGLAGAEPRLRAALSHPDPFFRANAALYLGDAAALLDDPSPEVRLCAVAAAERGSAPDALLARLAADPAARVRAAAHVAIARRGGTLREGAAADLATAVRHARAGNDARLLLARLARDGGDRAAAAALVRGAVSEDPDLELRWAGLPATLRDLGLDAEADAVERRRGARAPPAGGAPRAGDAGAGAAR